MVSGNLLSIIPILQRSSPNLAFSLSRFCGVPDVGSGQQASALRARKPFHFQTCTGQGIAPAFWGFFSEIGILFRKMQPSRRLFFSQKSM
jgi:hypothetical protein